jgi:hypothetical protein
MKLQTRISSFEAITNLSIAQTQILEMLQEVIPALLAEQQEMRSEMQRFHTQIVRLTVLIEAKHAGYTTH